MDIDSYLKHLRLIHFSFVLIGASSAYFILPPVMDEDSLKSQLLQFTLDIKRAQLDLDPWWIKKYNQKLSYRVSAAINAPIQLTQVDASSYKYVESRMHAIKHTLTEKSSLDVCRGALFDAWASFQSIERLVLDNQILGDVKSSLVNGIPIISIAILKWPNSPEDSGHCSLHFDFGLGKPKQVAQVSFQSRIDTISFDEAWFRSQYPTLTSYWKDLGYFSREDAQLIASNLTSIMMQKREMDFFGLKLQGRDLAVALPLISIAMVLYLLSYLLEARASRSIVPSPWIGTMRNPVGRSLSWLTLILGTIASIFLPLYFVLDLSIWLVIAITVISLVGAFIICILAYAIGSK